MNNIILIGMPGCGKSTIGVLLAKMLGYDFIDSDLLIQNKENKKLFEIIDDKGFDYFENLENEVLQSISAQNTVIATGGSAVYCEKGMLHLKKTGKVVFLSLPYNEIMHRITDIKKRGIAFRKGQTLKSLYKERLPLYQKYADITVNCMRSSISKNAKKIIDAICIND